jgi:hypothetical protein
MAKSGLVTVLLFIVVFIGLIIFALAIAQLISIKRTNNYSVNTNLQTAYDFSIGVLILNLFFFLFMTAAIYIYFRDGMTRSGAFTTLVIISILMLFGSIIIAGIAAARSNNTFAIVNLVIMIILFIIDLMLVYSLRRLDRTPPKGKVAPCPISSATNSANGIEMSQVSSSILSSAY